MKKCIYCGQEFVAPKPTTTMCQFCWYGGTHHEAQRPDLIHALRAIKGVDEANIEHNGGNCFCLRIRFTDDDRYLVGTMAYQEKDGTWSCDAGLPDVGEPWALGIYADEDEFLDGNPDEAEPMRVPLTDADLVVAVREIVGREVTR